MRHVLGLIAASAIALCFSGTGRTDPRNESSGNVVATGTLGARAAEEAKPRPASAAAETPREPSRGGRWEWVNPLADFGQILSGIAAAIATFFAARSAASARAAVVGLDRPFLIVRDVSKQSRRFGDGDLLGPTYQLASVGRTPVVLGSVSETLRSEVATQALATIPDPAESEDMSNLILTCESKPMQRASAQSVKGNGSAGSWDIILKYTDLIGGRYEARFRYVWDGVNWSPAASFMTSPPSNPVSRWFGGRGK